MAEEMLSYSRGNMHDAFMIFDPSDQIGLVANGGLAVTPKAPLSVTLVTLSGKAD